MNETRALVRRPGPGLANGLVTHITRPFSIDLDLALEQWEAYGAALRASGWTTVEVDPADDCPDAVFVEDTVVVYRDLAVVTRPGALARRREVDALPEVLDREGYRVVRIEAPGTLDGGDVLKHGGAVWVGVGDRSNVEGVAQLAAHLGPLNAAVVAVPLTKVLHLKSAVTALPDGTIIGYPGLVDDPSAFPRFRPVPEESGAHVVLLGGSRLLMAASAPQTTREFSVEGYEVVTVDISEFEKLEGCVTCLSVRLRR